MYRQKIYPSNLKLKVRNKTFSHFNKNYLKFVYFKELINLFEVVNFQVNQ